MEELLKKLQEEEARHMHRGFLVELGILAVIGLLGYCFSIILFCM